MSRTHCTNGREEKFVKTSGKEDVKKDANSKTQELKEERYRNGRYMNGVFRHGMDFFSQIMGSFDDDKFSEFA
jgi:hypothetical protein